MIMNIPGSNIDLPTLSERDEADINDFGFKFGIDMVAVSYVRSANCIESVRDLLGTRGAHIKIFAKI